MAKKKTTKKGGGYGAFRSDLTAEQTGLTLDYGSFRVTVARAGGSNKAYERLMTALSKPYTRAIQTETLDPRVSSQIMKEAMAKAVILNWEVLVDEDNPTDDASWEVGIEDPDTGETIPFDWENVLKVLNHPEVQNLYNDLRVQSGKEALFLQTRREEEGNS